MWNRHRREASIAFATIALGVVLAVVSPGFFSAENLTDLFLANMSVLLIALGMTLVVIAGEIDISVGSTFAMCGIAAGVVAKADWPLAISAGAACVAGALVGSLNGALVAYARIP